MSNKCKKCTKTAYHNESLTYKGDTYHATCFKCGKCRKNLKPHEVAGEYNQEVYCKQHYTSQMIQEASKTKPIEKIETNVKIVEVKVDIKPLDSKKIETIKVDPKKKFKALDYETVKEGIYKVLSVSSESNLYKSKSLETFKEALTEQIGISKRLQNGWCPQYESSPLETIEVEYKNLNNVIRIEVHESFNAGALTSVSLMVDNEWKKVYDSEAVFMSNSRIFTISLEAPIISNRLRATFNLKRPKPGYQLAAIYLISQKGAQIHPITYSAKTDFFDLKYDARGVKFPGHKIALAMKSQYYNYDNLKDIQEIKIDIDPEDFMKNYTSILYGFGKISNIFAAFKILQVLKIPNNSLSLPDPSFDDIKTSYEIVMDTTLDSNSHLTFLLYNFRFIPKEDLFEMPEALLMKLINNDQLFIEEQKLWEKVLEWGKANTKEGGSIQETLKNIIPLIRFGLIQKIESSELIKDLTQEKSFAKKERISIYHPSKILSPEDQRDLYSITKRPGKLIFSSFGISSDLAAKETFHNKCDSEDQTLTVVQTSEGYIFGAYSNLMMKKNQFDVNSYVFSLKNPNNIPLKMMCISSYQGSPLKGFGFGNFIVFWDEWRTKGGQVNRPWNTFDIPFGFEVDHIIGKSNGGTFKIKEIEIFSLKQ